MTKGIGTESFGVLALSEAGDAKRAAGNETAGAKRYSARTNRPSGGMNESDLSRAQRWSLVCPISNQNPRRKTDGKHTVRKDGKSNPPRLGDS